MSLTNSQYSYDFEIQTIVTVFMNALSDIVIKRFNNSRVAQDQIKTRLVYAPKQRVLGDLLDKDQNLQLPVTAVYIGGITRDTKRVWNKIQGNFAPSGSPGSVINDSMPVPINVTLNVTIATRFQADMDQIITHILPYVNPYFVVSWRTPGRPDHEIRSKVFWDGNANFTYPYDIASSQVAKVIADLTFTFEGWLFQSLSSEDAGIIYTIKSTYSSDSGGIPDEYLLASDTVRLSTNTEFSDYWQIDGVPPQPKSIDPYFAEVGELKQFNVFGAGLTQITNVYLSGAPLSALMTTWDPFSALSSLSADFPAFDAVKINSDYWAYDQDSYMTFVMPSAASVGLVDLIIEGPVGYGLLTKSVRVNTFNPFLSTSLEYASYVPYQMPYLSGIEIRATT